MAQHNELGKIGEHRALNYLILKGYKILDINWRYEKCELDIVCSLNNLVVFVEVKTRSSNYFGNPAEFVDKAKQNKLIEGAEAYLEQNNLDQEIRFDIVEVLLLNEEFVVNHIPDAFQDGM
jgi:putative endonuclease